jgi:TPR repeat protein
MSKAAELGDPEAISNMGIMYLNGEGVEKNYHKAFSYLTDAAEFG